jgi:hypothetical protein
MVGRAFVLALLTGCSFLVPPKEWHPTPQLMNEPACPPYLIPALDTLVASVEIYGVTRVVGLRDPTDLVPAILIASPWVASATYGWVRMHACDREL